MAEMAMRSKAACRTATLCASRWSGAVKRVNCHHLLPCACRVPMSSLESLRARARTCPRLLSSKLTYRAKRWRCP
jgi:hypothetical protein